MNNKRYFYYIDITITEILISSTKKTAGFTIFNYGEYICNLIKMQEIKLINKIFIPYIELITENYCLTEEEAIDRIIIYFKNKKWEKYTTIVVDIIDYFGYYTL